MPSWYRHPKRKAAFELVDEGAPEHTAADEENLRSSNVRPIPLHYDARAAVEGEADRRLERLRRARAAAIQHEPRRSTPPRHDTTSRRHRRRHRRRRRDRERNTRTL